MGALKKLVKRSLTSVFPALFILFMSEGVCVFDRKTICACVFVCVWWLCVSAAMTVSTMDLY